MDHQPVFDIRVATEADANHAEAICEEMAASAAARGTGIARRTPDYVIKKMTEGKAVIATTQDGGWAGFCYIETWDGDYVANSGLIVAPAYRKGGLARRIKERIFELSRTRYPNAKIFGLTTGLAVMKINSDLGYEPVTYSELTKDEKFWSGCKSCVNHEILMSKQRSNCFCTAMLFDPAKAPAKPAEAPAEARKETPGQVFRKKSKVYARFMRLKRKILMRGFRVLAGMIPTLG